MEKNEIYTCTVDGYTAEGMGVARVEGIALFIPGAAAGDRLRVRIVKVLKNRKVGIPLIFREIPTFSCDKKEIT